MTEVQQERVRIRSQVRSALGVGTENADEAVQSALLGALVDSVLLLGELVECSGVAMAMLDGKLERIAETADAIEVAMEKPA